MKDQFVTYEIAKKLKELGFDEPCAVCFGDKKDLRSFGTVFSPTNYNAEWGSNISAPLWQQAIDWLREKHNICIAEMGTAKKPTFELFINQKHVTGFEYATRKGALQAAVKKALLFIEETIENAK